MRIWARVAVVLVVLMLSCGDSETEAGRTASTDVEAVDDITDVAPDPPETAPSVDVPDPDAVQSDEGAESDSSKIIDVAPLISPEYPLDNILRVNHIQAKGTHNSYHIKPSAGAVIPDWDYTHAPLDIQLAEYGVRQVELDVHKSDDGEFKVFHVPFADDKSTCDTLKECLTVIKSWSDKHPGHHILFILIEPKDEFDIAKITDYVPLDKAILDVWPADRLLRPDDVRGSHPTLRKALQEDGWPTLGSTRNKAMFVMLDGGAHRKGYLKAFPNLEDAVIFMRGGSDEPWACCLEHNNPVGDKDKINAMAKKGFLVRSDADDHKKNDRENAAKASAALETGAHYISSDMPTPVDGSSYFFAIEEGSPSRCNPITAPPECKSTDIEAPPTAP